MVALPGGRRLFKASAFIVFISTLALLSDANLSFADPPVRYGYVKYVIDGDTAVLSSGEKIRYVGIDTPEAGEPFYNEAKARNKGLVKGKRVRIEVCAEEPMDKYGRTLAWVWAGETFVNKKLLEEGLAALLLIPPCGAVRAVEFKAAEGEARAKRLGIWAAER